MPLKICRLAAFIAALSMMTPIASADDWTSVFYAQAKLKSLGYNINTDGKVGPATRKALEDAGVKFGFTPTVPELIRHFAAEAYMGRRPVEDPALVAALEKQVGHDLLDPFSAHFRDMYWLPSGMICGEVNAKNRYGAYVGWQSFLALRTVRFSDWVIGTTLIEEPDSEFVTMTCLLDISHSGLRATDPA